MGPQSDTNADQENRLGDVVAKLLSRDLAALDWKGKRVLVRVDFNVPLAHGTVSSWSRVVAAYPTIRLLIAGGARVVLASHLGRPQADCASHLRTLSLQPVAAKLQQDFGELFRGLVEDCVGAGAEAAVASLKDGQVLLLENTRFHAGDEANSPEFAAALARLADVFVNDAFGACHRNQGSVTGVTRFVSAVYPGLLVQDEIRYLSATLDGPKRPFACVIGGAKVADKIGVLWALINKADKIIIGGRMAYTFLASQGVHVGATLVQHDRLDDAAAILAKAKSQGVQLILPVDCIGTDDLDSNRPCCVRALTVGCCTADKPCIPDGYHGADIGSASCELFVRELQGCATVFWNGPMGRFEVAAYATGTHTVARALAAMTDAGAVTVVGGGETATAVDQLGLNNRFTHISTGGGASLELIEGLGMPGLRALASQ